ncbi:MAG: nucleotidyltransferase family protein [Thermodesulfobacteriota bacterium]
MGFESGKIGRGGTIRDALRSLEKSGLEIVLVVDEGERLLGVLTDGDIRRALLSGGTLDSDIRGTMQSGFTSVDPVMGRVEVLDLMRSRGISQIPILDAEGRLVGLHTMRGILGAVERPNWAIVMAGGRGERLRPLTDDLPKPMMKVAGRPILERIVLHLVGFGIRRVFLSVNYKREIIERHFGDGESLGCRIEYLREERPLGSGGALSLLPGRPADPLLVLNGDLLTHVNVENLLAFHGRGGFRATVAVHEYGHTVPYGVVEREGERVTGMWEKPSQTWLVNTGIYVLEPGMVERVPRDEFFPLPALLEGCLARGEAVGAFPIEEEWIDVGHPGELLRARGEGGRP